MPRGRPKYDDILTPREWEVLELIRRGRTNEQIAGDLGITENGAKYHVAAILSKLGVTSRYEAATWRPDDVRRRSLGLGGVMQGLRTPALAAAVALGIVALFGIGAGLLIMESRKADAPAHTSGLPEVPATPAEFLMKVEAALAAGGDIARVQGTTELVANGQAEAQWSIDAWFDIGAQSSRATITRAPDSRLDIAADRIDLVDDDYLYRSYPSSDGEVERYLRSESPGCFPGEPDSILMPIVCGFSPVAGSGSMELEGEIDYGGRWLQSLVWRDTTGAAGGSETRLLVDPMTYLPVAQSETVSGVSAERRTLYTVQFVSRSALSADFFRPAALGFESVQEQQLRVMDDPDLSVPVYWPGRSFSGTTSQAQLSRVEERGVPAGGGVYVPDIRLTLVYQGDNGNFRLDYWAPGGWEEHKRQLGQRFLWATCADQVAVAGGLGAAAVLRGFDSTPLVATPSIGTPLEELRPVPEPPSAMATVPAPAQPPSQQADCPTRPYDRFMAEVELPQVTITINAPYGAISEPASHLGVYNSEAALQELVRSLHLRQTGE